MEQEIVQLDPIDGEDLMAEIAERDNTISSLRLNFRQAVRTQRRLQAELMAERAHTAKLEEDLAALASPKSDAPAETPDPSPDDKAPNDEAPDNVTAFPAD